MRHVRNAKAERTSPAGGGTLDVRQGIGALREGKVLAYPTEGVWGLGCLPSRPAAVRRLLDIKQRDSDKGLILIAACCKDLEPYIQSLDEEQQVKLEHPGEPVTWLVPAAEDASALLRGAHATQAVRITRHSLCRALCLEVGALVSTSANPEGRPPARTSGEVREMFGSTIDGIVEGPLGGASGPSEIRDMLTGRVVRPAQAS